MALTDNLVEAWELNEASGARAGSHGGLTLTDNNTVLSGTGLVHATVADFELSAAESLSRASEAALQTGDVDYTIEAWVNTESNGTYLGVVNKANTFGGTVAIEYSLFYDQAAARWSFTVGNGTTGSVNVTATAAGAPSNGTWYHLIAYHDAAGDLIGIVVNNGTPATASSASITPGTTTRPLYLGAIENSAAPQNHMDGRIGPVRLWKRVLSGAERTQLYNGGLGLAYSSFVGAKARPIFRRPHRFFTQRR
jgi:hypothetical protein